jgi:uncharacterized protein
MKILVSGATGLVGSALVPSLATAGHEVTRLVRARDGASRSAITWDPARGLLDAASLEGFDAVVHLTGESIATGRWNAAKKARIQDSRVLSTSLIAGTIARLSRPPKVLLCASAIGYYGDRGDEVLAEDSPPGVDFLSRVCRAWEAASEPAVQKGVRVVRHRFGMILSPNGGGLATMLPPFKLGAGGRTGSGRQFISWIAIDDVLGALEHALTAGALSGPVNTVSPRPVTNDEFTKTLGRVLRRPTFAAMPAFAARLVFGEMADALLLSSQRVEPKRLLASGYRFRYPDLEPTLRHLLDRRAG